MKKREPFVGFPLLFYNALFLFLRSDIDLLDMTAREEDRT